MIWGRILSAILSRAESRSGKVYHKHVSGLHVITEEKLPLEPRALKKKLTGLSICMF